MRPILQMLAAAGTVLALAVPLRAAAAETFAGLRLQSLATGADESIDLAIWYPTEVTSRTTVLGAITLVAALNAPIAKGRFPLVMISHGTGGSELGHNEIAQGLAQQGFVVAALRHPGDNYKDQSMVGKPAYLSERPRQVSRVIDALLADARWQASVDAQRIGIVGHSAGGFTSVALIGATPSIAATVSHCAANYDNDPRFCQVSGSKQQVQDSARNLQHLPAVPDSRDLRIKAAVLIAPVGAFFSESSLRAVKVPVRVYVAGRDNWLAPKYHAAFLASSIAGAEAINVENAGHFLLSSKLDLTQAVGADEVNADPAGFDRAKLLRDAALDLPRWFARVMP